MGSFDILLHFKTAMRKPQRKSVKFYLRLMRHPGTPESIGRGVAAGFFTAFIIPAGHMAVAFLLAVLIRGARGAAVLSTWITNPFTMPVVYPVQCYVGSFITGKPLSYSLIKKMVFSALHDRSLEAAGALSGDLIISFFAGGLLFGTIMAISGYFISIQMVRRYRIRRTFRKIRRQAEKRQTEIC